MQREVPIHGFGVVIFSGSARTCNLAAAHLPAWCLMQEWKELIAKVSNLQTSCTNGQLSYQEPVVTDYFDIPCTEMGEVEDG